MPADLYSPEKFPIQRLAAYISLFALFLLTTFLVILFIIIFPFFVVLNRTDKEQDEKTAIYPITKYFYRAICFFYSFSAIFITIACLILILGSRESSDGLVASLFVLFIVFPLLIFVHVHHLIIFLMAVQRFLLVFFPSSEPLVTFGQKTTNKIINAFHFLFILAHLGLLIVDFKDSQDPYRAKETYYYLSYLIFLNIIQITSAVLYIPIMLKIRSFAHLASSRNYQPQKFILYQTLFISGFKSTHIWALGLVYWAEFPLAYFLVLCGAFDLLSTPVLIQVSYLFCNKRNVETLRLNFSLKKLFDSFKFIIFPKLRKVEPVEHPLTELGTSAL